MTPMKWLTAVLGVLGLLALIAAIMYFAIPAHSLPSFLGPLHGPSVKAHVHRKRRGEAAIALAVVLWVVAGIVFYVGKRSAGGPATTTPAAGLPTSDQPAS